MNTIRKEYSSTKDIYSQDILFSQIELLLNYCNRFHNRQFLTRTQANNSLLSNFERLLEDYFSDERAITNGIPSMEYFANKVHLSRNYLSDMLRSITGQSAQQHIQQKIIDKAKGLLTNSELNVSEIAYQLRFEYPQSFRKLFKREMNVTPKEFRQLFN